MSNHDIDALMRKAFNLPAPPRPALPKDAEKDVMKDVRKPLVVLGDAPGLDGPLLLSDDLLDTLAAAGPSVQLVQPDQAVQPGQPFQPIQPVEPTSGIPSAASGSPNKKNWP